MLSSIKIRSLTMFITAVCFIFIFTKDWAFGPFHIDLYKVALSVSEKTKLCHCKSNRLAR